MGNLPSTCWFDQYFLGGFCPTAVAIAVAKHLAVWDATAGSYGKLNEPVELATGETLEIFFRTVDSVNWQTMIGGYSKLDKTARKGEVRVTDTGLWSFVGFNSPADVFLLDGRTLSNSDPYVADGKIHNFSLTRGDSESSLSYMYDHIGVKALYDVNSNVTLANHYDQPILAVNVYKADGTPKHKFNFLGLLSDQRSVLDSVANDKLRYVANLNGSSDVIETNTRLVDVDNLTGTVLEGSFDFAQSGTMFAQNIANDAASREFQIYSFDGGLNLVVGGYNTVLTSVSETPKEYGDYRFEFKDGDVVEVYFNNNLILSKQYFDNGVREPTATFTIGARHAGASAYGFYRAGLHVNIKVNGFELPLNDNRNIVKSTNATLGTELVNNGKFTTNVDGWDNVAIRSWESGRLKLDPLGSYRSSGQTITVKPNTPYLFKCSVETLGTGTAQGYIQIRDMGSNTVIYQKVGTAHSEVLITPTGTELRINLHGNEVPAVTYFDDVSLVEATGYASYNGEWKQVPTKPDTKYVELVNFAQSQIRPYIESVPYYGYIYQDMGVNKRPAYKFDGTAYAKLRHPRKVFAGQTVSFTFQMTDITDIANRFWLDADDALLRATVLTTGTWNPFGGADDKTFIDGVEIAQGADLIPYADGKPHTLTMTTKQDCTLQYIMCANTAGQRGKGYFYDLKVDDELLLPMDDGVGIVMRNVGFGLDADIISHSPDNWNFLPKYRDNYIKRNIVELDASAGGRVNLPKRIIIPETVDFSIKYVFYCGTDVVNAATNTFLIGGDNTTHNRKAAIYVGATTDIITAQLPKVDGSTMEYRGATSPTNPYNRIVEVVLQRVAGQTNVVVDGVAGTTTTQALAQLEFDYVNAFAAITVNCDTRPLELDVKVDGKQAYYYDFNIPKGETLVPNLCEPKGTELWDKLPKEYAPSTSQYQFFDQSSAVLTSEYATGDVILVEADIDVLAGQAQILVGNTGNSMSTTGNHKLKFIKGMDSTKQIVIRSLQTGTAIRVNNMSAKRVINWAELINVPAESNKTYTWSDEHKAWVSENLWDESTAYAVNTGLSQSTYINGVAHIDSGVNGEYCGVRCPNILVVDAEYLFSATVFDIQSTGNGSLVLGETGNNGRLVTIQDTVTARFTSDTTFAQIKRPTAGALVDLKVTNISFNHLLPKA